MLAYVFWHWPQANVDAQLYRTHLIEFHEILARNKPPGFRYSAVFAIGAAPWLAASGNAYEDWYIVEDSSGLDPLNEGAVSGVCEEPHNRVAREAAGGTAGLYGFRDGTIDFGNSRYANWISKPNGMSYAEFYELMRPFVQVEGAALWGRRMTLGPTTEFCLMTGKQTVMPAGLEGLEIALDAVWSGA